MKFVYLSPHLDDAVLSCGGGIHRHATRGEPVQVINVFAGDAAPGDGLSPFALTQHEYWGNPPRPMALRRAEDVAALTSLGVEGLYLDYLDSVYRTDAAGQWLYIHEQMLWENVHPADPLGQDGTDALAERLAGLISPGNESVVYAPLAIGNHVDHQIVHAAAWQLRARGYRLAFYEDYPYAERPGALDAALDTTVPEERCAEIISLDASDLTAKVAALAYYRTQMDILFGSAEAMPSRVWSFATTFSPQAGLAERIWWPAHA